MADFDFANEGGLAALGAGLKGFAQGMMDGEDRKFKRLEMEAKSEAQKAEKERNQFLDKLSARDKGLDLAPGQSPYSQDPATFGYRPDYLEKERQKAMITATTDPYGAKAQQATNAKLEGTQKALEIQKTSKENKRQALSPIQSYQKGENYVATPDEEKHLRTAQAEVAKFNGAMDGLKAKVAKATPQELANPLSDVSKSIKNDLRDLQLIYKGPSFAQLGVLTGPDLKLLEDIIENPGTLSNLVSGKDGVLQRYDQARGRVNSGFEQKVQSLGLVPVSAQTAAPKAGGGLLPAPKGKIKAGLLGAESQAPPPDLAAKQKRLEELRMKAAGR